MRHQDWKCVLQTVITSMIVLIQGVSWLLQANQSPFMNMWEPS